MTGDRPPVTDVNAVIDAHERSGYRLAVWVSRRSCSTWATVSQWCACTACRRRRSCIASSLWNWPHAVYLRNQLVGALPHLAQLPQGLPQTGVPGAADALHRLPCPANSRSPRPARFRTRPPARWRGGATESGSAVHAESVDAASAYRREFRPRSRVMSDLRIKRRSLRNGVPAGGSYVTRSADARSARWRLVLRTGSQRPILAGHEGAVGVEPWAVDRCTTLGL